MTHTPLLEQLTHMADGLGLPFEVGLYTQTPPPTTYLVATPLTDGFEVYADNTPGVEVEEARLSLFTRGSYLPARDRLTRALIDTGLTITARHYVGFEADTGYHHYVIDTATHHPYQS
ncbi:MAG: hypothetical protein Q4P06_07700 [Actinomycetaceae bacterium]|nr:hypothetical protein [Actinomycetaceae bacterium]